MDYFLMGEIIFVLCLSIFQSFYCYYCEIMLIHRINITKDALIFVFSYKFPVHHIPTPIILINRTKVTFLIIFIYLFICLIQFIFFLVFLFLHYYYFSCFILFICLCLVNVYMDIVGLIDHLDLISFVKLYLFIYLFICQLNTFYVLFVQLLMMLAVVGLLVVLDILNFF